MEENISRPNVSIVLCGIGGYGAYHVRSIRDNSENFGMKLVAVVDPAPERSEEYEPLKSDGVPIFSSLNAFFERNRCDLVVISSPVQFHCEQTIEALRHDAHVLCEKPLCMTDEEAASMTEWERTTGKKVIVGYQWSFSPGIAQLKEDILNHRFGRPKMLKTLVCWPRSQQYYQRNRWAGRINDDQGRKILDSPVSNATAHFLHNMLYVIGDRVETSASIERVEGRLFRANAIETYDTAALKFTTKQGVPIWFFTTHASISILGPIFEFEFEDAVVSYAQDKLTASLAHGKIVSYEPPQAAPHAKLKSAIDVVRGDDIVRCGIKAAREHTRCVALIQDTINEIRSFSPSLLATRVEDETQFVYVEGLLECFKKCYDTMSLKALDSLEAPPGL